MPAIDEGIASMLPLNARIFLRNLMRDESEPGSLMSAEDLSPEEVEEIYRRIEMQDALNKAEEEILSDIVRLSSEYSAEHPKTDLGRRDIVSGSFADLSSVDGRLVPDNPDVVWGESDLSEDERYQKNLDVFTNKINRRIKAAQSDLDSYERTRGKTSVPPDWEAGGYGLGTRLPETIVRSLNSPAYRINTTLGQFNAYKNEDGSTTIRDVYDWSKVPESSKPGPGDWLFGILPSILSRPEALGNFLMRTKFRDKKPSDIDFTLPPRWTSQK